MFPQIQWPPIALFCYPIYPSQHCVVFFGSSLRSFPVYPDYILVCRSFQLTHTVYQIHYLGLESSIGIKLYVIFLFTTIVGFTIYWLSICLLLGPSVWVLSLSSLSGMWLFLHFPVGKTMKHVKFITYLPYSSTISIFDIHFFSFASLLFPGTYNLCPIALDLVLVTHSF